MLSIHHLEYLGVALRELRNESGFSQAEVCARAGLVRPQLSRWENDHDVPTLESLIKYLSSLDSTLAALERKLLSKESMARTTAVNWVVREIRAGHERRIRSSTDVGKAEEELLFRFELQVGGQDPEPAGLAVILGRLALVAADGERESDVACYGLEAVRLTKAADREWPLPVFLHLWKTVMADATRKPAAGVKVAKALFQALSEAYGGFKDQPWEMSLDVDRGDTSTEIRLERRGPHASRAGGIVDEPVISLFGG